MNRFCFIHIPKTAGTSLIVALQQVLGRESMFALTTPASKCLENWRRLTAHKRKAKVWAAGHAPVITGVPEWDSCQRITILREPVGRVVSFCRYIHREPKHHLHEEWKARAWDLDWFLNSDYRELSNLQTKMLVPDYGDGIYERFHSLPPMAAVDEAVSTLADCAGVAIVEDFARTGADMLRAVGIEPPEQWPPRENVTTADKLKFEPRHLEKIAELNELDALIYDYAAGYLTCTKP